MGSVTIPVMINGLERHSSLTLEEITAALDQMPEVEYKVIEAKPPIKFRSVSVTTPLERYERNLPKTNKLVCALPGCNRRSFGGFGRMCWHHQAEWAESEREIEEKLHKELRFVYYAERVPLDD